MMLAMRKRIRDRVLDYLAQHPGGVDDDDLAIALNLKQRQQANSTCRQLAAEGLIERRHDGGKIKNFPVSSDKAAQLPLGKEIERVENSDAWDETDEVIQVEVKKPLKMVIPVRLSSEKWEELRKEAHDLGIGPTTLARMWILERLR